MADVYTVEPDETDGRGESCRVSLLCPLDAIGFLGRAPPR